MIKKSYKLIEFSNKEHGFVLLTLIAIFAFTMTLLASFSIACAKLSADQVYRKNVKSALRRTAWFVRNSYLKIRLISDDNFDFTEDLDPDQVDIVARFLKNSKSLDENSRTGELLFVISYKLHYYIEKSDLSKTKELINEYKILANILLEYIYKNEYKSEYKAKKNSKTDNNQDFSKNAKTVLAKFADHISKEKYPWYLISGTLLGLHREKGFLKHDIDIDLGIDFETIDDMDSFVNELKNIPETTIKNYIKMPKIEIKNEQIKYDDRIGIIKLVDMSGIQIDVFICYKENGKIVHGSKIHMWANTPYELISDSLDGIEVLRPHDPSLYLSENYGDWQTPKKEFSCSTDTPNLIVASNFYSISFFLRRLLFILQGREEKMSYGKVLAMLESQKITIDQQINIPFVEGV